MRPITDIRKDLNHAISVRDVDRATACAVELDAVNTTLARALADQTRADILRWSSDHTTAIALYDRALAAYTEIGDLSGIANVRNNMANLFWSTGDRAQAVALWEQALEGHRQRSDDANTARVVMNLGAAQSMIGDLRAALERYSEGLSIAERINNRVLMATAFGNIGTVYKMSGDYAQALTFFGRAHALHIENGNQSGLANAELNFGTVYVSLGESERALEHMRAAFERYTALGDRSGAAMAMQHIGSVHVQVGDLTAAQSAFDRSYAIYEAIGERGGMAHVATEKAIVLMNSGHATQAASVVDAVERLGVSETGLDIELCILRARDCIHHGEFERGHEMLHTARDMASNAGLKDIEARIYRHLRDLAYDRRDLDAYVEHDQAYHALRDEMRGTEASRKVAMTEAQRLIDAERLQKERHQELVYSMLPRSAAERVLRGEVVHDAVPFGVVLFIDMVGFTTMASKLLSQQLVPLLDTIFTAMDDIMSRYDLIKIKTIGDAYMAAGIDDAPEAELVDRMARAAVDIISLPYVWPGTDPAQSVRFRIGMHCGPLMAGVVGTQRPQYDIWGDTVNVASRMESAGEPGRIQLSEACAAFLPPKRVQERGNVQIKGKGIMRTFWLIA